MPKPDGEREFSTGRDSERRGAFGRQRDAETPAHPSADVLDEKRLVGGESFWAESWRVLMEPPCLIGRPVETNDHRGRYVGSLEDPAPLRDQLTVRGEHDCVRNTRRDVHRDLPTTVVIERLGYEISRYRVGTHRFQLCVGVPYTDGRLVIH